MQGLACSSPGLQPQGGVPGAEWFCLLPLSILTLLREPRCGPERGRSWQQSLPRALRAGAWVALLSQMGYQRSLSPRLSLNGESSANTRA